MEEEEKKVKKKFLSNSDINYLINIESNFIDYYTKDDEKFFDTNNYDFLFLTDSNISKIDCLKYKVKLNSSSFNSKIDTYYNLNKIKKLIIEDEYYSELKQIVNIEYDFFPKLRKGLKLDLSNYPFYSFNNKDNNLEIFNIPKKKDNKFDLYIFFYDLDKFKEEMELLVNHIKKLLQIDEFNYIFENIFVICQIHEKKCNLSAELFQFEDLKGKNVYFIFNEISEDENDKKIYNIFLKSVTNNIGQYFILSPNNEIVCNKIYKNDCFINKILLFIRNLKIITSEKNINFSELAKHNENKGKEKMQKLQNLINFIMDLKNKKYLFKISFSISFKGKINPKYNEIISTGIDTISIEGELMTKDKLYLEEILYTLGHGKIKNNIIENKTIDIDIDFSDMKCFKCSKIIEENKYLYYCFYCKTKYCFECVSEQLKKEKKEKYIDKKHNLLFFKTRDINAFKNIETKKLGNNLFANVEDDSRFKSRFSAMCNGCSGGFNNSSRYLCLTCRPGVKQNDGFVDYCHECINQMCNNEN